MFAQVVDFAEIAPNPARLGRASNASGIPSYGPHDLRHRRATLRHLQAVPPVEAASWLGHSAREHLRTYAHVVIDRPRSTIPPSTQRPSSKG
jgi:integrase